MNRTPVPLERVQRKLAAAGGQHIGDLVAWNCERIDVPRALAREAFATENFGHVIPEMDPATALSRAAGEVRRPFGIFVRPFARPKGDTSAAVGIYVQHGRDGEGGDDYVCGARCRVASDRIISLAPEGAPALDQALAHAEALAAHANHLIAACETRDISAAMVATVRALSGVPLRDRGGFYLLPPQTCGTWSRLRPALQGLGVDPIRIEMHDVPDNIAAAKAAAAGALEADISELMMDLERAATEGMRQHALVRRVEVCKELCAKAELYRGVLAGLADRITGRVQELERQFQRHLDSDTTSFAVAVND